MPDSTGSATGPRVIGRLSLTHILLLAVFAALLLLILLLAIPRSAATTNSSPGSKQKQVVNLGQQKARTELPASARVSETELIPDTRRVQEVLRAGSTYRTVQKGSLVVKGHDPDWTSDEVVKLALVAEQIASRTIESNDGVTLVEVRTIETARVIKILCATKDFHIELGDPDLSILKALDEVAPGEAVEVADPVTLLQAVLKPGTDVTRGTWKVVASVDQLSGKKIRLTHTNGIGVTNVEPVNCSLTEEEVELFFRADPLADMRFLPDLGLKPGESFVVPGYAFAQLLDPELHPHVEGNLTITRGSDLRQDGHQMALLKIDSSKSDLQLSAADSQQKAFGRLTPKGTLLFDLDGQFVRQATLSGEILIRSIPKDHALGNSSPVSQPETSMTYSCQKL